MLQCMHIVWCHKLWYGWHTRSLECSANLSHWVLTSHRQLQTSASHTILGSVTSFRPINHGGRIWALALYPENMEWKESLQVVYRVTETYFSAWHLHIRNTTLMKWSVMDLCTVKSSHSTRLFKDIIKSIIEELCETFIYILTWAECSHS